jgi:hypothetical protein
MEQRLMLNSILVPATQCWLWLGRYTKDGYPLLNQRLNGKHVTHRAHRLSFNIIGGGIPVLGMELDHICHNRACINPDHLVQVSKADNLANRRGYRSNGQK